MHGVLGSDPLEPISRIKLSTLYPLSEPRLNGEMGSIRLHVRDEMVLGRESRDRKRGEKGLGVERKRRERGWESRELGFVLLIIT